MTRSTSGIVRRAVVATAIACGAAVLLIAESPWAQPGVDSTGVSTLDGPQAPAIESTTPFAEATGVSGRNPLIVQFNKHMAMASLNSRTFTLVGPAGAEPANVVPLEEGKIVFVWPRNEMLPASRYTLFVKDATDNAQRAVPLTAIGFDTATKSAGVAAAGSGADGEPDTAFAQPSAEGALEPPGNEAVLELSQLDASEQRALQQADRTSVAEDWIPGPEQFQGRWRTDRAPSPLQALPPLRASAGITAVSGQVLGMNGRAVRGVTLRIGEQDARTDVTGRFLLQGLRPGFAKLEIDGATADRADVHYGYYATRVELKPGQTTVVPFVIWMPRLDPAGSVHIPAPTMVETVITSPRIPGLELRIPAGTVIRDREGRIVTELNMTAIPVDRPPFPVPDLGVPVYFTVQPGGAVLQSMTGRPGPGARLFYPNFKHEVPGARGAFWNYDPEEREWFVYGLGSISADATQAIPDDGVVIHELTGAMFNGGDAPPPPGPPPCATGACCSPVGNGPGGSGGGGGWEEGSGAGGAACGLGGDPVSLSTGQLEHTERDMVLNDVMPIEVTRTYDSADRNQRAFGIGINHAYDIFLFSQNQYQEVDLILANGTRVHYVRTSPGNDFATAVFQSSAPGPWHNSIIARNQTRLGWDLFFRDGRKWFFFQFQPLMEMTDSNGNVTHIVRQDAGGTSGKVTRIVSPNGRTIDFSYNPAGFVSALTDNLGRTWNYSYDAGGRLTSVIDPLGGVRQYSWDIAANRITSVSDQNGNVRLLCQYDDSGRVANEILADGSGFSYAYTAQGNIITQTDLTDRRGNVRRVNFAADGYVVKNTFPLGLPEEQVTTYEVSNGQTGASIDALNRRTEYRYDDTGNPTQVTRLAGTPNAVVTTTTYDPVFNQPLTATDENNHTTSRKYDERGNLTSITDPLGHVRTFTHDSQGRQLTKTDPLGKTTTTAYDNVGISSVTDPLGRQAQVLTDAIGRPLSDIDPLGHRTAYDWDDMGHMLGVTDALGGMTSYAFDANGNRTSIRDARGNVTNYSYNSIGKLQRTTDANGKDEIKSYEPGGQLAQIVDRKGQIRTIAYDALGRVTMLRYGATLARPAAFTSQIEKTWDRGDRLIQVVEKTCANPVAASNCSNVSSSRTTSRTYDDLDRMIAEITPQGEIDYTYDNAGRRVSMTIKNGPFGSQVVQPAITYTYDDADRLTAIDQAAGAINANQVQHIGLEYDADDRRAKTTLANGSTISYVYDDAGQMISIVYGQSDGTQIGDLQYEYDLAGHRVVMSGSLAQLKMPTADVTDATYDSGNRLLTWGGQAYTYDDNGNLNSDGTTTYEWNDHNKLKRIVRGGAEIMNFQYDSRGRRISKTIGSETTGFLYDGWNVAQELLGIDLSAPVKTHLLTGQLDEVFLRSEGNDGLHRNSLLSDANNNIIMLLDGAQQRLVSYSYEPYGRTGVDASNPNTQQYASREADVVDSDNELYYYRARYYVPGIGRFISEDPVGWPSGHPNAYLYADANPVTHSDPMGKGVPGAAVVGCRIGSVLGPEGCAIGAVIGPIVVGVVTVVVASVCKRDDDDEDDTVGCAEQWAAAYQTCAERLSDPWWRTQKGYLGPNLTIEQCARGQVDQRCGGNVVSGAGNGSLSR